RARTLGLALGKPYVLPVVIEEDCSIRLTNDSSRHPSTVREFLWLPAQQALTTAHACVPAGRLHYHLLLSLQSVLRPRFEQRLHDLLAQFGVPFETPLSIEDLRDGGCD